MLVIIRAFCCKSEALRLTFNLFFAFFAGLTAFIAVVGLYGLLASVVAEQAHEFGVRLALGATAGRVVGPQVHDARIAALCRLHGVRELWTADRDFTRFDGLVVRNPLIAETVRERPPRYRKRARVRA